MDLFTLMGRIVTNSDEANKDIDKTIGKAKEAETETSKSFGGVGKAFGSIAKVGAAVVGGAGIAVGGLTAMVGKLTDTTGAIKDASDRAGMSAEEFQKWTFAAEQSGMSMESLQSAMVKQQKNFSAAKTGNEAMAASYAQLGLDITKIGSSSEAFDQVMAKLGDMQDETQRNALAADIFGKSYAELTPLLNEGSSGMDDLKKRAVDLGAVMSNDTVAAGEQLGDTLDQVKAVGAGLFNSIASSLMPVVQDFADLILDNMPMIQGMMASIGPALGDFLAQALPILMQLAQQLLPVIFQIIQQLLPVIVQLLPLFISIVQAVLPPLVSLLNLILPPLTQLLTAIIPPLTAILRVLAQIFGTVLTGAINALMPIINGLTTMLQGIIDFVVGVFTGNWQKAWDGVTKIFSGAWEALKSYAKAPLNFIIDMINKVFGSLGELKIPDWVPLIGGKSFSLPQIPRLAEGTPSFKGGAAIVGEYEPELVELPRGARVTPFSRMPGMPGQIEHVLSGKIQVETTGEERLARKIYEYTIGQVERDLKLQGVY